MPTHISESDQSLLKAYRRRLLYLAGISSAIDTALFGLELPFIPATFGGSLIVEEGVEWIISSLLAKNKMELKKRYKIVGLIPIPGVTSLTLQCILAYRKSRKNPEEVLAGLRDPNVETLS